MRIRQDQVVTGSILAGSVPFFHMGLIMKYFLVSFWHNNVHKYWLTTLRTKPAQEKVWLDKLAAINMTLMH